MAEKYTWWKHGVLYEIWPRSFYDSDGDGSGDLRGIVEKLDYLSDLGVDGVWLGPVNTSPMVDQGYDVSDYRGIDPLYGSMADFDLLVGEAHRRGIRVIMDMVFNHTSDRHPWFVESRSSRDNPKRDWYIWHDGRRGGRPNNWAALAGGSAWARDRATSQYYLHSFMKEQPDLNWRNGEVRKEIYDIMRFWLDKGVDGFRLDIMNYFLKDDALRDNPWSMSAGPFTGFQEHRYTRNRPGMEEILKGFRSVLDEYDDRMMVAEVYVADEGPAVAASYLGKNGELGHLAFDFSLLFTSWEAAAFGRALDRWYAAVPEKAWPCNVFSNHDRPRAVSRYAGVKDGPERAKLLAAFLLTTRGTPFIYYGEEIGLKNSRVRRSQINDTLGKRYWPLFRGRDAQKNPMQWSAGPNAGFSTAEPWLPLNKDHAALNVERQKGDSSSILEFYRRLIALRREKTPLHRGEYETVGSDRDVLAYRRTHGGHAVHVALNFSTRARRHRPGHDGRWKVLLGTHRGEGSAIAEGGFDLCPHEAVIFERDD
jgi:alpha-glucosidase